ASPVTVKIVPESVIFGRVLSDGEPVESISVKVMALRIPDGHKVWEKRAKAMTDEERGFRWANLTPGTYHVVGGARSGGGRSRIRRAGSFRAQEVGYSEVFYPGVADIASATQLELAPGQQAEADFSLKPQPVYQVSGEVNGNMPDQGVNLEFVNSLGENVPIAMRFDREDSKFQARLL